MYVYVCMYVVHSADATGVLLLEVWRRHNFSDVVQLSRNLTNTCPWNACREGKTFC